MTFGEKLRQLREAAGLTLSALAKSAGIGLATVKDYEGNRRTPSLENAQSMANALGVSCQEFEGCEFQHVKQRPSGSPPADVPGKAAGSRQDKRSGGRAVRGSGEKKKGTRKQKDG